jgi:magnesium-transporting ATPase (P-type)
MEETQWDIKKVKRLKKKQLLQINLVMLLLFLLFGYFSQNGKSSLIIWGFCVIMWLTVVITFFTLKRRPIGTKTSRILQKFDKDRLGQKRWKRRKIIEFGIISVISVFVTVLVFSMDFNSAKFDFPLDAFPFIGAWVGTNIGEIVRISNL